MESLNTSNGTTHKKKRELPVSILTSFFEQLHTFYQSGITVWESLSVMAENAPTPEQKRLYDDLYDYTVDGFPLSEAMASTGRFPDYAINMCTIGEQTGHMDETLDSLRAYYVGKDALSQAIRSAVAYPLFMAGMVLTVIFVLIIQVMPVFQEIFAQLGLGMNPFATFLLTMGQNFNNYALITLSALVAVLLTVIIMQHTIGGKKIIANLYDLFPVTRKLARAQAANSLAFSVSLMLSSGIDTITAFELAETLLQSNYAKKKVDFIKLRLEDGYSLNDVLIESKMFEAKYNGIIVAGNRVGTTDNMLMSIAKRYQTETERRTQQLLGIIEPILVGVLCTMVGMVMLSVMLPLMGILSGMQV